MIADLKPYADYKESGLPWLGRVPAHWSVVRIKSVLRESDRRSEDGTGTLLSLTRVRGLIPHRDMTDKMYSAKTLVGYKRYRAGQLVMNRMQAWSGMFGAGDIDGLVSPDYAVFEVLRGHTIKLVLERLKSPDLVGQFALESKGIGSGFNRLYTDRFGPISISLPPPNEQTAIVRFLDWANGRLERAIRAKRKVIALLNEQKQAIIHRAVTRGLDPSVPLKPSGIPWLGEIPAHWDLSPNRAHLRIRKVLVGQRHPQFQLLSLTKRGVIVRDLSEMRGKFSSDMGTSQEVRSGDLVFCLFDVPETPRTVGLSQHDGMITGAYTVVECSDLEVAKFLELFYIAMDDRKLLSPMYSGLRNTIPKDRFLGAKTPLPSAGERVAILRAVQQETSSLIQAISRLEREIDLLREYRTRLVADVVTGKLDVSEASARLPGEEPLLATPDTGDTDPDDNLTTDEEADA
jgi:type I restriction enzyme S subunit